MSLRARENRRPNSQRKNAGRRRKRARSENIPVIAFAGSLGEGCELVYDIGISALFSIVPGISSLENALADGSSNLTRCARNVAAVWSLA